MKNIIKKHWKKHRNYIKDTDELVTMIEQKWQQQKP